MTRVQKILLLIIFLIGFCCRLYKINNPIADWHSHRQADTASVTDNLLKNPNPFYPIYHDLSNIQSGLDNPMGYRFVEFPLYNLLSALLTNLPLSSVVTYRLTSILLSLVSAYFIFLITRKLTLSFPAAIWAVAIFLLLPFNIYYSRAIIPEPLAILLMLSSLYFLLQRKIFLSVLFLAIGLTVKPYIALLLLPSILVTLIKKPGQLLFFGFSLLPFAAWRLHLSRFPEGIPAANWLLNNNNASTFPDWYHGYHIGFLNKIVAFRPYWFNWLFFERISQLILGSFGLIPLFLGLVYKAKNLSRYLFSFLLGILLYFVIVAGGNIQHDYYQSLITPFLSIIIGIGYYYLYRFTFDQKIISILAITIIFTFSTYFSAIQVKEYYKINHPDIVAAGQQADKILPQNALVVAPYTGDTAFLYQTHRSGWPTEIYDFDKIKQDHPQNPIYLVSVNFDSYTNNLLQKYPPLVKNDRFTILKID